MPPNGYNAITISDDVFQQVLAVMSEYDCVGGSSRTI